MHTKGRVPDTQSVRVDHLGVHAEHGFIRAKMPQLTDTLHSLQYPRMAPDLDLWLSPEQAEVLRVMYWKPGYLGVSLRVGFQVLLPACGLGFWYDTT